MEFELSERLAQQLAFVVEVDQLKNVLRRTRLMDGSRLENTAEHSWHLALMAVTLAEHAPEPIDLRRVLVMALIHDIVEIDAGDTFAFDQHGYLSKAAREQAAATRLFGLLPPEQAEEYRQIWEEFEAGLSAEARFAVALDRLEPLLCNHHNGGGTWREHAVPVDAILRRMAPIETGAPPLWPLVEQVIAIHRASGAIGD
ncbi:MAG TPA: HD domain-containing protein [Roseiflexaceae bacterium]|nr:HD domain-containing protein [Roseiflexaceae bacterium]